MIRVAVLALTLTAGVVLTPGAPRWWQAPAGPGRGSSPVLRFHHWHYRVGDPSAAMRQAAATFQGVRVLLRGLGVGVRIGDEYVLFDRAESAEPRSATSTDEPRTRAPSNGSARTDSRRPETGSSRRARIADAFRESLLDHVAFVSPDLPRAVGALRERGAVPIRETGSAALFHARERDHGRDRPGHGCAGCVLVSDAPGRQVQRDRQRVRCAAWRSSRCPTPASASTGWTSSRPRDRAAPASRSCA